MQKRKFYLLLMSMFTRIFKNKILFYGFLILLSWIIGNIFFFTCSITDKCIFKKPNTSATEKKYMPTKSCIKKFRTGNSFIKEKNNIDIMVLAPNNHYGYRMYPLLIIYAPSGKTVKKSEKFYNDLTSYFTNFGYLVAYVKHMPLGEKYKSDYKRVIKLIENKYCLNNKNINILGHSDGGTISGIVGYSDINNYFNTIIMSASGLNKTALDSLKCPSNNSSYLILHNQNDFLFPNFGTENYNWLKKCFSCSKEDIALSDNCLIPKKCNSNRLKICYNNNSHSKWKINSKYLLEFIREGIADE